MTPFAGHYDDARRPSWRPRPARHRLRRRHRDPRAGGRRQVRRLVERAGRDRRPADGAAGTLVTAAPVDAAATDAWRTLSGLADGFSPDLRGWFAADPDRVDAAELHRGRPARRPLQGPGHRRGARGAARPRRRGRASPRAATRCSGASTSTSPRTAPSCTPRCGSPRTPTLEVDGQDVVHDVHEVLQRVYAFADQVRSGEWTGVTGERIRTVVNIGIGGSDLGPVMAYEALEPYRQDGLECRFISNIDPTDAATTLKGLDPATTLFIVSSKTFGTLETLTNARLCKAWLLDGLRCSAQATTTTTRRSPSTSSPCRPRSTRSPTSASTPTTRSASGTGSAAATPWTPPSAPRWWSRSVRSASPSSSPACTRWTSTSAPPSRRATCRS